MKYRCLIFDHKWMFDPLRDTRPYCKRCGTEDFSIDRQVDEILHDFKMSQMKADFDEAEERTKARRRLLKIGE